MAWAIFRTYLSLTIKLHDIVALKFNTHLQCFAHTVNTDTASITIILVLPLAES